MQRFTDDATRRSLESKEELEETRTKCIANIVESSVFADRIF